MFPGLITPGSRDQRRLNAASVGQLLRSSCGGWLCSQGCFNPGSRDQRRLNAESVANSFGVRMWWGICSQGCFNPGSLDQRRLNAASVGQLLRSSYVVVVMFAGLKQPGAEFSERLRCLLQEGL